MDRILTIITGILIIPLILRGQEIINPGEITSHVNCIPDSTQSYSLFLPASYSKEQKWPIIFIFEPAARAMLPLEKYHALANKFGYILMCSYNSRNGPNEPIFKAANAMYSDAFERFSLDENRIYLSGFSGGARVSCLIALSNPKVNAVIGCGAGFPYSQPPREKIGFDYLGIIGKQDMNFFEVMNLDSVLNNYCQNNLMLTFPQGHQWPDSETYRFAFYWLETKAMRNEKIPTDHAFLKEIEQTLLQEMEDTARAPGILDRMLLLKSLTLLLDGLSDISQYKNQMDEISSSDEYLQAINLQYANRKMEAEFHKRTYREFEQISLRAINPDHPVKSQSYWRKEYKYIEALDDPNSRARLFEFLINGSWEQHINSRRAGKYEVALSFLKVYEAGLPDDPSPSYYYALVYASDNRSSEMYRHLERAIEKGLKDSALLTDEPLFQPWHKQKKFINLVAQLEF